MFCQKHDAGSWLKRLLKSIKCIADNEKFGLRQMDDKLLSELKVNYSAVIWEIE